MRYERIRSYLLSLEKPCDRELCSLRDEALASGVPIIREETESLIRFLLSLKKPKHILEIGTAVAYSSILMARSSEASIVTIESFERRIAEAKKNIACFGLSDRIELLEGDAGQWLRELSDKSAKFDFVFLDAAKAQYINWLPDILSLMEKGGILLSDNVLQDETVMESRFTIERRERTTHVRMREFLYSIKHDERLESTVLPLGDGVSISVLK